MPTVTTLTVTTPFVSERHLEIAVEGPIVSVYSTLCNIKQVENLSYGTLLCLICCSQQRSVTSFNRINRVVMVMEKSWCLGKLRTEFTCIFKINVSFRSVQLT